MLASGMRGGGRPAAGGDERDEGLAGGRGGTTYSSNQTTTQAVLIELIESQPAQDGANLHEPSECMSHWSHTIMGRSYLLIRLATATAWHLLA